MREISFKKGIKNKNEKEKEKEKEREKEKKKDKEKRQRNQQKTKTNHPQPMLDHKDSLSFQLSSHPQPFLRITHFCVFPFIHICALVRYKNIFFV